MKIAILYICTGKYNVFWKDFYSSCEKYFLPENSKTYFVFTDNPMLSFEPNIHLIKKECRGFPLDSLFRFEMFLEVEEQLKKFDYIFFFNANMLFIADIGNEILPDSTKSGLIGVQHPGHYAHKAGMFPYERNKASRAYIPKEKKNYFYYMGSLNGGTATNYLELIRSCAQNIRLDYEEGIIAYIHDESHLNHYFNNHEILMMNPGYAYPEGRKLPFTPKIIIRDKVKIDPYFDKHSKESFIKKIIRRLKRRFRGLTW